MSGGHLLQTSFRCRPVADVSPEREYVRLQEVTGPSSCSSTRVAFDPKRALVGPCGRLSLFMVGLACLELLADLVSHDSIFF